MTPESLIANHLCLRVWLLRIVLPTMLVLLALLFVFMEMSDLPRFRDHNAAIAGFIAGYFCFGPRRAYDHDPVIEQGFIEDS